MNRQRSFYIFLLLNSFFPIAIAIAIASDFIQDLENFQQQGLSLKSHEEKIKASKDHLTSKKLFWTPDLSMSVGKSRSGINHLSMPDHDYAQASANLNLFKGGADILKLQESQALLKAQELIQQNQVLKIEKDASRIIFKAIYIRESLHIQQELLRMKEESLKIVKGRYQQGKTPFEEVTKAEVDLGQQQNRLRLSLLALAENDLEVQSSFIQTLQTKKWPFSEKENLVFSPSAEVPRIEQKRWLGQANLFSWKAAQRQHIPTIDFSLQYQVSPFPDIDNRQWNSVIELKIPLWSQYETQAAASSALAGFVEAQNDLQQEEKVVELTRAFLLKKLEIVKQNLQESKKNLEKTRKLYQDLLQSFRLGRLSTNDLLIEQNRVLENESTLADGQLAYHEAIVEICTLLGSRIQSCLQQSSKI